ncbi:MATE family efflux transporter [Rhodobacter capsulatus]|uniref:MATE family efflux transporter n=1 Tax=Rhodobacter capsulatus TaxID=1061 RepID=UPI0006DC4346|nr:MATE family efflux transporter [Rhodobacter capsulatus]KQB13325.1 MATE family efflux transporter [Rhodobacter capsulatus]KQB13583.1 MATE family efflux transporter [Rhodobacter capsulatus]PZX24319.1 MATE family multidrug resistance protein [Rhodobacter capsulatus]QNR63706.1 MATE family efflux transporter [Rhodobacter capsulatus]
MTEITHGRVLRIAAPIVISNATVPLLGAVDTAVVGQIGQAAPIGAVGLGAVVLASVYWIFGFLRMGTTGLVAQAKGEGDSLEVSAGLIRAVGIGLAAGLCLIALQAPMLWAAFQIAPASAEVETLARDYLSIRIWGAPATISLYAFTGWLIALERTRAVLVLQLVMNGLNVGLDLWFVLGLGWGVKGVAAATLIAELSGLVLALWLARAALVPGLSRAVILATAPLKQMARVNTDIMIRSVILQGSFTAFLFLGAGQGDVKLAANQVLLQFLQITAYALDGFAFAAESLVGQAVGARAPRSLRRAAVVAAQWGVAGAALLSAAFLIFGGAIIDTMTTAPEVRDTARAYLPWIGLAPLLGIAAWMFDGIFIGATLTREMRNAMLVSVAIYIAALCALIPAFGNHGLWAALMVLNLARGITMARLYPRAEAKAAPAQGGAAPL